MRQDPKTRKEYDIIHEQLARGVIERVDETSTTGVSRVHYLLYCKNYKIGIVYMTPLQNLMVPPLMIGYTLALH